MSFPNLAGRSDADKYIQQELDRCGIQVLPCPPNNREVPSRLIGKIGDIVLTRNWYYWVADGWVPLEIAQRMWDYSPVVRKDVRVAGHCGCPPPAEWAKWRIVDTDQLVIPTSERASFERMSDHIDPKWKTDFVFSDFPKSHGAEQFVENYHIDSELGLYLYTQFVTGKMDHAD